MILSGTMKYSLHSEADGGSETGVGTIALAALTHWGGCNELPRFSGSQNMRFLLSNKGTTVLNLDMLQPGRAFERSVLYFKTRAAKSRLSFLRTYKGSRRLRIPTEEATVFWRAMKTSNSIQMMIENDRNRHSDLLELPSGRLL
jgi:hypothetical protein